MASRPAGSVLVERYEILDNLSESADSALYRIKDVTTDTLFFLQEVRARRLLRVQSFTHQMVIRNLVHPNLPRVQDQFESDGSQCLVLTHCGKLSLQDSVATNGRYSEVQVAGVASELCSVLSYLHGQTPPVIFRSLRPANLFVGDRGQLMLLEAGNSDTSTGRPAGRALGRPARRTIDALPTNGYAPPEPNRGNEPAGDVYAMGATLYFLLTGVTPPPSAEMVLGERQLQPLRELRTDVSARLVGAIERMMALDRSDRPTSIEAVVTLLGLSIDTLHPPTALGAADTAEARGPQPTAGPADPSQRTRHLGEVLHDRYHLEEVLGRGGMGAVYLATHLELEELVAIKEMLPPRAEQEAVDDCIRQFKVEARILNRLRHPNLPRVYDFFETEGRHYLVMDYIKGLTLEKAPTPDEATVLKWAAALCDVLGYLHHQDPPVIFRDLKPSNIMLDEDGTLRLIDFGIAKVFEPEQGAATKTILQGAVSPGYAAPEQYGGGGTDERVDVYALGATMFYLLTGQVPPPSMELALGLASLQPLREIRAEVSERTANAVDWMMAVIREDRPRTMEDVSHALGLSEQVPQTMVEDSVPLRIKRLLREEFQYFFPAPWLPRPALLDGLVEHLSSPDVSLICLTGEAGVGKSRLLESLGSAMRGRGLVLPPIQGTRATRQQPFGALVGPARGLLREGGDVLLASLAMRLDEVSLHEMAQMLPEMRSVDVSANLQSVAPLERTRLLLDGFRTLLEEVSSRRRLLLLLDDVQWMDSGTLRLVDTLLATEDNTVTAAVVVVRQTGVEAAAVDEALQRWGRRTRVIEQAVPEFTRAEMRTYLEATLPPIDRIERHLEGLHAMTGGNALWLEELIRWAVVRHLFEDRKGMLALRDLHSDMLPDGVEDSARRRLEMLPLDSQELMSVAAVAGEFFDEDTLSRLSAERVQVVRESLNRAHEAYFVRPLEDGRWTFVSESTREACYGRLSASHRRQLHLAMGRLEEERPTSSPTVSYHFEQAGDVAKSLEHLSRFSRDFLAPTTVEVVLRDRVEQKQWSAAPELNDSQLAQTRQAISHLTRAIKSTVTYGAHSPIASTSIDMGYTVLAKVLKDIGTVVITCGENLYSINNRDLNPRDAPADLAATFRRHKASGCEIRPGLDGTQMARFLDLMAGAHDVVVREGGWAKALAARQITAVQMIENLLVEVSERDLFDPTRLRQAQQIVVKGESGGPAFSFDKMQAAPAAPVAAAPVAPSPPPVESGSVVTARDVGASLDSIKGLLEELRQANAVRAQQTSLDVDTLKPSSDDEDFQAAWDALNKQAQREEIFRLAMLARSVHIPLESYLNQRPELLVRQLESEQREIRLLAAMGLLQHGSRARLYLLRYLGETDHAEGRAAALFLLSQIVRELGAHLIHRLVEATTEEEALRLLRAIREAHLDWLPALRVLLRSSSSPIRRAVGRMLVETTLLEPQEKIEALREALKTDSPPVVLDMLMVVSDVKRQELTPDVSRILDRNWCKGSPEVVRAQVQACYTLARISQASKAIPVLRVVLYKGLQAALLGTWDSEVRAAATWALGMLPCDETRDLLTQLLKDSDAAVRGAARLALDTAVPDTAARQLSRKSIEDGLP